MTKENKTKKKKVKDPNQTRAYYPVLSEKEHIKFISGIQDFIDYANERKNELILAVKKGCYMGYKMKFFNKTTFLGALSGCRDYFIAQALGAIFVDLKGVDIILNINGEERKISSKAKKKMFLKSSGTSQIIDSNKMASSDDYDDKKHMESLNAEIYIMVQSEEQIIIAVGPKYICKLMMQNTKSNTKFTVPNDSYIEYIVSKEDNIKIDPDYVPDDVNMINMVKYWNLVFDNNYKENNETKESV